MRAFAASVSAVAVATVVLVAQSYPPPFPRPGATKLFENDRVRVWDVVWNKADKATMHRHVYDVTGAFYVAGDRLITGQDGVGRPNHSVLGSVPWAPKDTVHVEQGVSDPPPRAVLIEVKDTVPSGQLDTRTDFPPAFPRENVKKVLENEKVIVWDYTWTPGKMVPMHRHTRDAVVVWLADGKLQATAPSDPPSVVEAKLGGFRYSTKGTVHTENVTEGQPRAMVFELK